jgi:hypothetical protein
MKASHNGKNVCGCKAANHGKRAQARIQHIAQQNNATHPHQGKFFFEGKDGGVFIGGLRKPPATNIPTMNRINTAYKRKAHNEKLAWAT